MNTSTIYSMINGRLLPAAEANITVNDLAIQRGYGVFDYFKVVNGQPVFLPEHLDRFMYSATAMRLETGINMELLVEQISRLQKHNNLPESGIRLTLTGGPATDGYSLAAPNLIITQNALDLVRQLPAPIHLATYPFQRQMPGIKTIDYLMAIWLQPWIKDQAANDVLYYSDGVLRECPRANFFIINESGELQTTREKLLWGITRKKVLTLAATVMPVVEKDISFDDLANAREAFISSTTKHITPVTMVNGHNVGSGHTGEWTQLLSDKLLQLVFPGI